MMSTYRVRMTNKVREGDAEQRRIHMFMGKPVLRLYENIIG